MARIFLPARAVSFVDRARVLSSLLAALTSACAIRLSGREHYVGPVFYRHTPPCRPDGAVVETAHAGMLVEAGSQTGVALGLASRLAATAVEEAESACAADWSAVAPIHLGSSADAWSLSPFYLRARGMRAPTFTRRVLVGMEATVGPEARSLSLGIVSRTRTAPPPDSFCSLRFNSDAPLQTRIHVWPSLPPDGEEAILKEVE